MAYARGTEVASDRTMIEIKDMILRRGGKAFGMFEESERAVIVFELFNRRIRFDLPLPKRADYTKTSTGKIRTVGAVTMAVEQSTRERWRALQLVIRAKLESFDLGIETFEEAFLAHVVMPSGETVGKWAAPQLAMIASSGTMPPLLPKN